MSNYKSIQLLETCQNHAVGFFMTLHNWLLMVPYPSIEVLRLPTSFFQNRPRTTKALSPIFCGQGAHCSIAGICFSAESEPEISLCLTEALKCIELGGMKPEGFLFGYLFTAVVGWGWENLTSCCAVYGLLKEWPGKNRHQGLAYNTFFNASNPLSLFVFLVGLDFKLIKEDKHWLLLCFPLLLFSLCQVLVILPRIILSPFHLSSIHFSKFWASIRNFLAPSPGSAVLRYPPGLLVIFSPLLPSSASCTLHSSMLVSSFSALILQFTIAGQIMLLKKTTGCKWRGKQEAAMEK